MSYILYRVNKYCDYYFLDLYAICKHKQLKIYSNCKQDRDIGSVTMALADIIPNFNFPTPAKYGSASVK